MKSLLKSTNDKKNTSNLLIKIRNSKKQIVGIINTSILVIDWHERQKANKKTNKGTNA